jgi:hypothetical protein
MVREQKSVYQESELRFLEVSGQMKVSPYSVSVITGLLGIHDGDAHIQEIFDIAADCLTVQRRIELFIEYIQDFFLIQRVVIVRILA